MTDHLRWRAFTVVLVCTRQSREHRAFFNFLIWDNKIMKIGQYPSRADIERVNLDKYRRILGKEKYREFVRAVGLVANGIGVGSFVYLRRIFEHLIEQAATESKSAPDSGWDEQSFRRKRMDEKIN